MSQGRGSIPERIRRALYVLSRGRCYAPNCDEPVLAIVHDEVVFVGNVAHIVAASSGGPRAAHGSMNTESFANLLVLCGRHHAIVDDAQTRHHYPPSELRSWKETRESEFDERTRAELHSIDVSAAQLRSMIVQSFKETTAELSAAIDRMEHAGEIAHGAAVLLLDSASALPEIDRSAQLLMMFADAVPAFDRSAQQLANFIDVVSGFDQSAQQLGNFIEVFPNLDNSTSRLAEHSETLNRFCGAVDRIANQVDVHQLTEVADRLESAADRVADFDGTADMPRRSIPPRTVPPPASTDDHDWGFVSKVAAGAAAVGLVIGLCLMGWMWWHHASSAAEDRRACTGASPPANFTVQREVEVEISGTKTLSPSPYICETWYPEPIPRDGKR